jgi:hypothetical protein
MDFLENIRSGQQQSNDDSQAIADFNDAVSQYAKGYTKWARGNNGKFKDSSKADIESRVRNLVKQAGISDGAFGEDATDAQIAAYGNDFLSQMQEEQNFGFSDYIRKYGTEKQQKAYEKVKRNAEGALDRNKNPYRAGLRTALMMEATPWFIANEIGTNIEQNAAKETLNAANADYNNWLKEANKSGYDLFDNYENYIGSNSDNASGETANAANATKASATGGTSSSDGDVVTFQLDRANDPNYKGFGQKIVDLGLATDNGLWGSNGDVAFYTQQLYEQGAVDKNGNLKIGVPIKLRRRK